MVDENGRGFGRRGLMAGAAGLALGGAFGAPVLAQGARTLRVRFGSDISQLDPARIFQNENQSIASHIYNGLVQYDQRTNAIVPDLASSHEVSADGTVWTFRLRPNVTWHKGYGAFTSDDVKFSFERVLDPATGSLYRGQFAGLREIQTPDPMTVRLVLDAPNSGFLHKLCAFNQGWIVSRRAVTEIGERYSMNPIGTGPFVFERWTAGNEVRLSANPDYFAGPSTLSEVVFRIVRDETAAAIALENRELDIFYALQAPEVIERLRRAQGVTVLDRPANNTVNLVLNTTAGPLRDVRVRRAMAHAMNRRALIDGFFRGTKFEATSVLTSTFQEFSEEGVPRYAFDPDRARALLREANVSNFRFEITTVGLNPFDRFPVALANDLQQVGIQATVRVLERGAYVQARSSGNVQSCITAVVGPPDPDSPLVTLYHTRSHPPGLNTSRYDRADELLAEAARAPDLAGRRAVYNRLLRQTMEDLPVIPLYADRLFIAHGPTVQGFVQNSLFTVNVTPVSLRTS
ncbi:ABC transporter substrate-binding protein [Falsiroseomonas oryziterrae]|uniref:ABC transporter substrate-binding protein n=1 Tax=Falsiroseomonas oryziterrae TaxID=2911368 RepID=UPI001F438286|nr:ABC transporter substrate-binding protein [Roseomonas sp. NPKOSM-4]